MNPLLAMLSNIWGQIGTASSIGDTTAAAATLQNLDPGAFTSLFPDTQAWDPTSAQAMGTAGVGNMPQAGFTQQPEMQLLNAAGPQTINPTVPPQIPPGEMPNTTSPYGIPPMQAQAAKPPVLTAEQMMMLQKMMPQGGEGIRPPSAPAAIGRPQAFNANMAQLGSAPGQPIRRPTLAELIYGRR